MSSPPAPRPIQILAHLRRLIALIALIGAVAQAVPLNLTFSGGTAPGGGSCTLTAGSICRYTNVVQGATGSQQRDATIQFVGAVAGSTLTGAFDDDAVTYTDAAGNPLAGAHPEVFSPTVVAPAAVNTTSAAQFRITFYTSGGSFSTVNAIAGSIFITSLDTDGDNSTLRELVQYNAPVGAGRAATTLLSQSGTTNLTFTTTAATSVAAGITTDSRYKASARYDNPATIDFFAGAVTGATACTGVACQRLGAYSFVVADSVYTPAVLDVYKTVRLTTDQNSNGQVNTNDVLTYTVTVVNTGSVSATGVQVTDALPAGLAITATGAQTVRLGGTVNAGARNTGYTGAGVNDLLSATQTIAPGSTISIDIPVRVTVSGTSGTLNNQASVTGTNFTTLLSDNLDASGAATLPSSVTSATGWPGASGTITQSQNGGVSATSVNYVGTNNAPLTCTNTLYALLTDGVTNSFRRIAPLNPNGTVGTTVATVPSQFTNLNAALGINSAGTRIFVATDVGTLEVYDVISGAWVASVPVPSYTSSVDGRIVRMTITPNDTGYFSVGTKLWSFQTTAPYTINAPVTLSYTDSSGLTPTPTIVGSGDFFAGADGNLYLSVNNGTAGSFLDTFKVRTDGSVIFLGRLNDPDIGTDTYGGYGAVSGAIYGSSSNGRIISVDLTNLTVTQTAPVDSTRGSTDLASCSYPNLAPAVTANKTASVVAKASGNTGSGAQTGDTLEYTIVVRNGGTIAAPGTTFSDSIPAGTTYVAGSTTLNGLAVADVSGVMPYAVSGGSLINSPNESSGNLRADTTPGDTTDREATIKFRVIIGGGVSQVSNQATITYVDGPGPILTDGDTVAAGNQATTTTVAVPDLTITKTHTGTWTQADLNRTYTLTVTNSGAAATTGTVTVTDTLPTGLKAYRISGTGWTCTLGTLTCTRSDSLAPGASYPPITLVVDVDTNAPVSVTNSASVSGGGETNTANNTATDPTSITATATGTQNCSVLSSASPTSLNFSGAGTLVSGTANTQGAVYRFSNVATGVDALVTVTNLSATSATLLQGGLSALLTTSSSAFVDYKVDLVQAGTSTPITPIDVVAYSFDIDGVGVGNPLSDYAQFTGANSVFLNSPTRLTLTGLLAAQSATYVGYNDTVNDPRNAAGGVYLDVNSFTLRAGVQGATSSATRGINFDLKTSNSSSFTLISCSDQTAPRTADLSVTKTDGVTSVNAAGTTTYTVTVSNAGPNSTTATLTDPAVTGLTKTGVTCTAATGGAVCPTSPTVSGLESGLALGKIPSGATLTFSVTANVTATSGSVSNTVTVAVPSTTIEPSTANNSATDTDTVTPVADLSVTKTDGVSSVNASGTTTYTIRVTNAGPSSVTGATLTDAAVAGLTVTSVACSGTPGQCSAAPTTAQLQAGYALPALASGQFYELTVTGTVTATGGSLANTATVAAPSGTTDPSTANNTATDTDTVTPVTDVAVSKTVNVVAAGPGGTVTYTIRAWNNGPSPAGAATLTDTVSASLTGVTWTCAGTGGATCSAASGSGNAISVTVNLGTDTGSATTADTQYVTLTVTGTLVSSATGTLGNTASVSDASDSTPANNTASVSTRVVDAVNDTGSVTFNQGATFTILANDTVGGAAATTSNATLPTIVTNGGLTGLSVNASGQLVLAASALNLPGTYTVTYQICDATLTTACDTATIAITVTPAAADLAVTKAQRAGTSGTFQTTALSVVQGGTVQYQIVVTNNGPSAVTNAPFTDAVPANLTGLSVVSATGTGTTCTASFTASTLNGSFSGASGTSCTVTIQGTATTTGTFTNTASVTAPSGITDATTGNNTASVDTTVTPAADLAIDKSGPVAVGGGGTVSYTIRVWNNGPSSVTGATVTDSLPSGFTVTGISCAATGTATCGTQTSTASSVSITTGTLSLDTNTANAAPDGNFLTYTLTGTAPASGTLSNTASVAAPAGTTDPTAANNTSAAAVTRVVDAVNDATVNLAFGTGGTVTVLGNDTVGGAAATTANVAVTVQNAGGITGLTVNASGQLVVPAGTPAGSYTVTYQICDATVTTACDAATVTVNVGAASADLTITKTGPAFAKPGETITYTLTVTNAGPNSATGVTVSDTLPTGLTYVSSAPAATVSGQTLSWTLGTLAASASQTITVTATAPVEATLLSTPATRTLTNTASVSSATTDPTPANNTATAVTQMVAAKLTKSVRNVTQNTAFGTSGGGLPGEVLEYCIAFENIGGAPLPNFVVTDHVPGTTNAQTGGYDAEEASAATGFGVKLTRGTTTPTTSYFTSAADADVGALSSSGGTFGRGTMTVNLGALTVGDQGSVCFRTAIR